MTRGAAVEFNLQSNEKLTTRIINEMKTSEEVFLKNHEHYCLVVLIDEMLAKDIQL